jgi:hypothetical protein
VSLPLVLVIRKISVAVFVVALFGCAAHQGNATPLPQILSPARNATQAAAGHLYAISTNMSTVSRYPIRGGTVSTTPDKVLNVRDPACTGKSCRVGMYKIDLDAAANLYVTALGAKNYILIYRPGAFGNARPIRKIDIRYNPIGVKVDSRGYVYVVVSGGQYNYEVDIYSPSASGDATPVATIPGSTTNAVLSVALSPSDALYVGRDKFIGKYASARTKPRLVSTICNGLGHVYSFAIAPLQGTTWMYAAFSGFSVWPGRLYAWKGLRDRPCPQKPGHRIQIAGLPHGRFNAKSVALDPATNTLYASDGYGGKVYELNALNFQPQTPMATISLTNPDGLALGP